MTTTAIAAGVSGATIALSQDVTISATSNPAYLVVDLLDRNEYTAGVSDATGDLSANGVTLALSNEGGDARGAGIVYTWSASSGQYVNAAYGDFSQLDYTASTSPYDVTNISFFTTASFTLAQGDASSAYALMTADPSGYAGSITISSDPNFAGPTPAQATPDSIAATAENFVGDAWNDNGCWVLASTIAAEAGAGLPVQSTAVGVPGAPLDEWTVLFNGPAGNTGNWQSLVSAGDIVSFVPASGGGHITTCVSGSGATAMLVDNIAYMGAHGQLQNSANDGSASDVSIAAPHAASQEFTGVAAKSVVIYALDTPLVTALGTGASGSFVTLDIGSTTVLSKLAAATDPAHKAITQYQIYDSGSSDSLVAGGAAVSATSPSSCITTKSLASVALAAGATPTTDTLEIRAYNGTYWGDWTALPVNIVVLPPVLSAQTASQSWLQGKAVTLTLPASAFKDPQGLTLSYAATETGGAPLPSWLNFNPATRAFSGTVPAGPASFSITMTATDTAGLSASEHFTVNTPAAAPVLTDKTPNQSWAENSSVNFALPGDAFTDPQGEAVTLKATLSSGAALPTWLSFNASTGVFAGTAPAKAQTLALKITATDTSGLSTTETFNAAIVAGAATAFTAGDWSGGFVAEPQMPAQASVTPMLHHALPDDHLDMQAIYPHVGHVAL